MLKYYLNLWDVSKGETSAATLWSDSVSGGRPLSWLKWTKLAVPWAEPQGMKGLGDDGQALQRRNGFLPVPSRLHTSSLFTQHTWDANLGQNWLNSIHLGKLHLYFSLEPVSRRCP